MSLELGAKNAIELYLNVKINEKVLIITDKKTLDIGKAFENIARKITNNVNLLILEDYGKRPLKKIPSELKKKILDSDVILFAAKKIANNKVSEVSTLRKPIRELCYYNKKRYAVMPGITKKIMEQGMSVNPKKIQEFSNKIYNIVKSCKEIKVKTKLGTDIIAKFNSKIKWINSDGNLTKPAQENLPGAEVYTCPYSINGKFIVDGLLGDYFTEKYGFLDKNPIYIEIRDSRAVDIKCENKELEKEFIDYLKTDNGNRVGEFAIGTNIGLKKMIESLLQDEKIPGIHIAFGNPYPKKTCVNWSSNIHIDCVIKNPTIFIDNKKIMEKGRLL